MKDPAGVLAIASHDMSGTASVVQTKRSLSEIDAPRSNRPRRPRPEMVIAYLRYAVDDVRVLSPQSTALLERAISNLVEEFAKPTPETGPSS